MSADKKQSEILTHEEIRKYLERNNATPELGKPVYVGWTNNTGKCFTQSQLEEFVRTNNIQGEVDNLRGWTKRLNAKKWRIQLKGQKEATVIKKPVRTSEGWTEVEMNSKQFG